jgi:hypothetical protein
MTRIGDFAKAPYIINQKKQIGKAFFKIIKKQNKSKLDITTNNNNNNNHDINNANL